MSFPKQRAPFRRSHSHVTRILQPGVPPATHVGAGFDGTSSYIESTTGVDMSLGGALTIAAVMYVDSAVADLFAYFGTYDVNTARIEQFRDLNSFWEFHLDGTTVFTNIGANVLEGQYSLVIWTRATGTSTPRFHYYDGATWTHVNGSGTQAAAASSSTDRVVLGCKKTTNGGASLFLKGEMATLGVWSADTDDSGCTSLVDFNNWESKANKEFYTGTSLIDGGTMVDSSSHANSETARSTITAVQPIPSWFLNFPPSTPAGPGIVPKTRKHRLVPIMQKQQF